MSGEIEKLGKHTLIYGLGLVLNRGASLIMLPLYTRYLSPADYGAAELLTTTIDVLGMIVGLGIASAIFKCYADAKDSGDKHLVISTALLLMIGLMIVMMGAGILYADPLAHLVFDDRAYAPYFQLMFITYFLQQGIISIPMMYLRAIDEPKTFVLLGLIKLIIQLALNVYFLAGLNLGLMGILLSSFIGESLLAAYLVFYSIRSFGLRFSARYARDLLTLGYPFVFTSLSSFVLIYSDRFFLQMYTGLDTIGIYALAYKFGFALGVLAIIPIQNAWEPKRFAVAHQEDGKLVFRRVFLYFNVIIISLAAAIVLFVADALKIIAGEAFWPAAQIVPIIIVNYVLQAWTFFCDYGLYHAKKTGLVAASSAIAAVCVVALNFALIPLYGAYGAAMATFGAFLVRFGFMFTWSQSYFPIDYGWNKVILLVSLAAAAFFLRHTVGVPTSPSSFLLNGIAFIAFLWAVYYFVLSKSDRHGIWRFLTAKLAAVRAIQVLPRPD